jgi:hypothetical protein
MSPLTLAAGAPDTATTIIGAAADTTAEIAEQIATAARWVADVSRCEL